MCVCVCVCLWGAHPNLGPAGSTLPNGGVCFENWGGGCQQTKVAPYGGVVHKFFICGGAHPNPKPAGSVDQSARDYFTMKL